MDCLTEKYASYSIRQFFFFQEIVLLRIDGGLLPSAMRRSLMKVAVWSVGRQAIPDGLGRMGVHADHKRGVGGSAVELRNSRESEGKRAPPLVTNQG